MSKLQEILNYYGYSTIDEFANEIGLSRVDAEQLIREMYAEDTAPLAK